jgi:hypothetical protein
MKIAALIAIALFVVEALFRVDLAKHVWLVVAQAGLALISLGEFFRQNRETKKVTLNEPQSTPKSRMAAVLGMSSTVEFVLAITLFVLLIALTVLNVLRQTVDSDEPQHLHTVWGWTRGYVQYRDLFDNHMPLFHIALAPIFAAIGERATIVYWMRLALLPLNFVAAWSTYRIGAVLFSRRAGIWAMLGLGLFSGYYRDATIFAPANLWLPLWLLCLLTFIDGKITIRRSLVAGVLLGFCFAVSMKSVVFAVSLAASGFALLLLFRERRPLLLNLVARLAAFVFGTVLIPAIVMIFFAVMGTWREFRYDVFDFNLLAGQFYKHRIVYENHPVLAGLIAAMILAPVVQVSRWFGGNDDKSTTQRRVFILFVCAFYFLAVQVFWLPISRTYRPIFPLLFVLITGALLQLSNTMGSKNSRIFASIPLPAFIASAELLFLLTAHPFLKSNRKSESDLLRQVLALTTPEDYVLDSKGEAIFRKRTSPLILERITNKMVGRGVLIDDAPRRCVETKTCLVATSALRTFSPRTRDFVEHNYLPISETVRVAGTKLIGSSSNPNHYDFEIVIPAFYQIISSEKVVSGNLDGANYNGPTFLQSGRHTFDSNSSPADLVCLWSPAVERHFGRN